GQTASCSFSITVRPPSGLQFTRYLAFGDSITEGGTAPPVPQARIGPFALTGEPYPLGVERRLTALFPQQSIHVINAGVTGEVAYEAGIARFRGVLANNQPDGVCLIEGSNDISSPSEIERGIAGLDWIIQQTLAQGRRICL